MVNSQGNGWTKFIHIWPSASLGKLLEISTDLTRRRINLGYMDTESQLIPLLDRTKDAEAHYNLAKNIYVQSIRSAVLSQDKKRFLTFLQTEAGAAMLRNYEYAADLGLEQAKEMVRQIHRIQEESEEGK